MSEISANEGIKVQNYVHYDTAGVNYQRFIEILPEPINHNFVNLLRRCAHVFMQSCVSWLGYISTTTSTQLPKSIATLLQIIKLSSTNDSNSFSFMFGQRSKS